MYALTSIIVCITNKTDIRDSKTLTLTVKEILILNPSIVLEISFLMWPSLGA